MKRTALLCALFVITYLSALILSGPVVPAASGVPGPAPMACDPPFVQNLRVDDSGTGWLYQWTPDIAIDDDGIIYIAWADNRNGGGVQFDIYFCRSDDGGMTFSPNIKVSDGTNSQEQTYPKIVLGPSNEIYVVWHDYRSASTQDIYFARSTNGGASFDANVRVDDTGAGGSNQMYPAIACDGNGVIYASWVDERNGNYDIYASRSIDGGLTFLPNIRVDDTGAATYQQWSVNMDADQGGNVSVVWRDNRNGNDDIFYARSTDSGVSYNANVRVDDTGTNTYGSGYPDVAVGADGNISVIWGDQRNGNWDVYYSKSVDDGLSFGADVRVDDAPGTEMAYRNRLAVDDGGKIMVAWEDTRATGQWDIWYADSTDGGLTFNPNLRADDSATGNQWNIGIAAYNGDAFIVFGDQRLSNADDIFFTRTDTIPPVSEVDALPQYWYGSSPVDIPFTATDNYCLYDITLWYRSSTDNSTWDSWTPYGTLSISDKLATGNFTFSPPVGDAFYELYTIARDRAYTTESAPPVADAALAFDTLCPVGSNEHPIPGSTETDAFAPVYVHLTDQPSGVDVSTIGMQVNGSLVAHTWSPIPGGYNVSWVPTIPFADGSNNSVSVYAEDFMDNTLDHSWFFYSDSAPPQVSNVYPAPGGVIYEPDPTIYLHATDFSNVVPSSIRLYVDGYRVFHDATPVPDGFNVSYWHDLGFDPGQVVTCRIIADDTIGHTLDYTWDFTYLASYALVLGAGWNFISFPVQPTVASIESVLDSVSGSWDVAQYYDAAASAWRTHSTFKPAGVNDLSELDHSMGLWLHTTSPCTLFVNGSMPDYTVHYLKAGWNLVGYPSMNPRIASEALAGTGCDAVMAFNASAPYRVSPLPLDYPMMDGEAYWVHVPADTAWVVDW